jgi:hypothetical protein
MSEGRARISLPVSGMTYAACARLVVSYDEATVTTEELEGAIEDAGYTVVAA